jgi:hypothetical protein
VSKTKEKIVECWCRKCGDNTPHDESQACVDCGTFFGERDNADVGVKHSPHCACRKCWGEKNSEPLVYGVYEDFRKLVDAFCAQFKPEECYIYPAFAVFEFKWTADCNRFNDYIEDRSATRYTGIHYDSSSYKTVLIDVAANKEE